MNNEEICKKKKRKKEKDERNERKYILLNRGNVEGTGKEERNSGETVNGGRRETTPGRR